MGGRQSRQRQLKLRVGGLKGQRYKESQRNAEDLHQCILLSQGLIKRGKWLMAIEANRKSLEHLEELYCDVSPVRVPPLRLNSGERNLVQMLVRVAALCNRLLRLDLTERYLKVARALIPKQSLTTPDIMLYQLQTTCFHGTCQEVIARMEAPDAKDYLHSVVNASKADILEAGRVSVKQMLLDASRMALAQQDHISIFALLKNKVFDMSETDPEGVSLQCERDSMIACSSYLEDQPKGDAMSETFERIVSRWRQLKWPLLYADVIVRLLSTAAKHYLSVGQTNNAVTKVNVIVDLGRQLWAEQHVLVGMSLHDLGLTASATFGDFRTADICQTTAYQVVKESTSETHSGMRKMVMGVILLSHGLLHNKLGQLKKAEEHFKQCVPLLEESQHSSEVMRENAEIVCRTLAHAYGELGHIIALQGRTSEDSVRYKRLALKHRNALEPHFLKCTLARLAHDLHYLGAAEGNKGNFAAARSHFREAENTFLSSDAHSTTSYEPFAYGYFLHHQRRFAEASEMMLKAYEQGLNSTECVFFTQSEQILMTEEIKFEVQHAVNKIVTIPVKLAALYFCVMALANRSGSASEDDLKLSLELLEKETEKCDYLRCATKMSYLSSTSAQWMECTCYSLLAYAHEMVSRTDKALQFFETAYAASSFMGQAARLNIHRLKASQDL